MAFFNEFPHTRTYDSDLAWLIERMKEVLSRMDSVEARMRALEELVENFIASLNIDEEIKNALRQMILDGAFNSIIQEMVEPYLGAFNSMELTFQEAVPEAFFAAKPTEITTFESATMSIYENAVMARIVVLSKWKPNTTTTLTFLETAFSVSTRISDSAIAKLESIPVKDPDGVSAYFTRQVGAFGCRNGFSFYQEGTGVNYRHPTKLTLYPLGNYTPRTAYRNGGSMAIGGNYGSIIHECFYVKDTV